MKAFFYEYKYYLLPQECASAEDVKRLKATEVKRLKEENCMAPDFVYESVQTEFLKIEEPDRVFPATVNLYTKEEYDARLKKQVEKRCPGCVRYGGDSNDLEGHHREIALDGVCYSRAVERELPSFGICARWFWEDISEKLDLLAEKIGQGDQRGLNGILNGYLERFFLPLEFYGGVKEKGEYFLCVSANVYQQLHGVRAIVKMLAETANRAESPMAAAGWRVYPYFPKEIYRPSLRPDYFKRPPRIFYSEEAETGAAEIVVYERGAEEWSAKKVQSRKKAIYAYLCRYVGEDVLLGGSASLSVSEKLPEGKKEISAEELSEIMERRTREIYDGEIPFPAPLYLRADETEIDTLPLKEKVQTWATVCPEMSPERLIEEPQPNNTLYEEFGIVYAYIYLPTDREEDYGAAKKEVLDWYLSHADEYPQPITLPEEWRIFVKNVGVVFASSGLSEDCMVFDEKEFFRVLRNLAPVLEGLRAKIVTVKRDGVIVYEPGYRIRPVDAGLLA